MSGGDPLTLTDPQLRLVLDAIPARVSLLDRGHRHRYVNKEYAALIGRPIDEILGRTAAEILGEAAYDTLKPLADRALGGEMVRWEGWLPFVQGRRLVQRVYVPYRAGPDAAGQGAISGYFVFARDLTELKNGEWVVPDQIAALQTSEALATAITQTSLDCIITIDEAGLVVEFNPAAEKTFGYSRTEAISRPIGDLIVPPALRDRHKNGFERYLRTGTATVLDRRLEIDGMRADGSIFPVELTITEVRLPHRRLFTAYLRDLSAARAAQAEIERHREALHQSEKMAAFGSLLAGVAHELNNPLSIVIGNALILQEEAETAAPALTRRAERIQAAAERCGRIVRTFLAMARKRKAQTRSVSVGTLIDGTLELLAYGLRAAGIEIEQAIAPDLAAVECDPDQIIQVLSNLMVNARQALEGEPQPRRVRLQATGDGEAVSIEIADNGPGIPADIRSRIFDPFFTTKPVGAGTGIGLSVSRSIADAHGGSLTLEDSDRGARFIVRLPLGGVGRNAAEALVAPVRPTAHDERVALIVDDEHEVGHVLSEMLASQGIRCDVVTDGAAALDLLRRRDYRIIICDVRMPGIDGPALYDWMAEERPHLCARIAFVTGDTLGQASESFLTRTGRPLLEKPFLPADVRRLVDALLAGEDR